MQLSEKLSILAGAARYDVSCASSGIRRKQAPGLIGNSVPSGICHSFTEDGRCVSLLKILMTNYCIYDCAYCVNRFGNDIPRAAFTPSEIVQLTLDFYRRNYIEGLFLSSGVMKSPDDTMERLVRAGRELRQAGFNGYVHLKCIPHASPELVREAGLVADRLSVNIELPSEASLKALTKEKTYASVLGPMGVIRDTILESRQERRRFRHAPVYAPAGQSTQLIIGASPETDYEVLHAADELYQNHSLKRVYYSAFIPVAGIDPRLPREGPPALVRENRLYQADWLIRLYGFSLDEVVNPLSPQLDLSVDPKQVYAMRHRHVFPVDVNTAPYEMLLRVPGIGLHSAKRIVGLRKKGRIRYEHLKKMGVVVKRASPYIHCDGLGSVPVASVSSKDKGQTRRQTDTAPGLGARSAHRPLVYVTDATFEGLLTAVFETYAREEDPETIQSGNSRQMGLFERWEVIVTDPEKADRVWTGIGTRLGKECQRLVFHAFLSGTPGMEAAICRFIRQMLPGGDGPAPAPGLSLQMDLGAMSRKVRREAHRMKGLIRFVQTEGGLYMALVAPVCDVLPLIRLHFEARYADERWVIYDTLRKYGLYHDPEGTCEIRMAGDVWEKESAAVGDHERLCQSLWRRYFDSVNIPLRGNPKVHLSRLPRRYWEYLPEKSDLRDFPKRVAAAAPISASSVFPSMQANR